jgi:hypothetical protein
MVPAAIAAAVFGAAAIGAGYTLDHSHSAATPKAATHSPTKVRPSATRAHKSRRVTRRLTLAGFTLTFDSAAGAPDPVFAQTVTGGLPSGVTPVPLSGTAAQAWAGKDPATGDNALYVKVPTTDGPRLFVLLSATWSEQQLIELFKSPQPSAVPEVSGDGGGSAGN